MRKRSVLVGAGAVGASLVLLLSGCSSTGEDGHDNSGHEQGQHDHESSSQPADAHNDADVAFTRDMIPHHEQAVVMSDIVLAKQGIDSRVTELATQIKSAQDPEIETMRGWLREWGSPSTPSGHRGHDMSGDVSTRETMGMMTDGQLEALRQAQGADASRLFLAGMIEHHEGAVRMAKSELSSGQSEAAKHLAHEIIESQQREIDEMKKILGSL